MSDDKKNEKEKEKKKANENEDSKGLNFVECPIHGIRYPNGGKCPLCK